MNKVAKTFICRGCGSLPYCFIPARTRRQVIACDMFRKVRRPRCKKRVKS